MFLKQRTAFCVCLVILGLLLALQPGAILADDNAGSQPDDTVAAPINTGRLVFVSRSQNLVAGSSSDIIMIQVQGDSGNPIFSGADIEVNLASTSSKGRFDTSPQGNFDGRISKVVIPHGSNQVMCYYQDTIAGTAVITATNPRYEKGTQMEIIRPAEAVQVLVEVTNSGTGTVVPAQNITAGDSITIYALARDGYANLIGNIAGDWSLINKTGKIADTDLVPAVDGKSAVFTGHSIGTANIHVTSPGLSSIDSGSLRVIPGSPAEFFISRSTDNLITGLPNYFDVIVRDAGGNTVTNYTGTVHFTSTDTEAVLPPDYTFVPGDNGSHRFAATPKTAGVQSISINDISQTSILGSLVNIEVINYTGAPPATIAEINQLPAPSDVPAPGSPTPAVPGASDQPQEGSSPRDVDKEPVPPAFWFALYIIGIAALLTVIFVVQNRNRNQKDRYLRS